MGVSGGFGGFRREFGRDEVGPRTAQSDVGDGLNTQPQTPNTPAGGPPPTVGNQWRPTSLTMARIWTNRVKAAGY